MASPARHDLPRRLGLLDATSLVIGTVIGVGVFIVPASIAAAVPNTPAIVAVWIVTGIISFLGALAYAELGAMLPHSGGQYVYLREAYGPLPAFLSGWLFFLVIQSGSIATVTVGFSRYLSYLFPSLEGNVWWAPPLLILALTAVNYVGVRAGAVVQNIFTALKLGGLGLLITGAFLYGGPSHIQWEAPQSLAIPALGVAALGAFVAYDGWHAVAFVAGEISDPQRNLPRALGLGVGVCAVVYLTANLAYLYAMPLADVATSSRVAADTALRTLGPAGATLVTLTIVLSSIGAANGAILTSPRVYFAQARDGLFFAQLGRIHPRFATPSTSILAHGVWTAILAMSGSYEALFSYVLFISWMIHAAAVAAVIVLRRRQPDLARPYRMWGYPAAPLLFLAFALWFIGNTLHAQPKPAMMGALILLSGLPVYHFWAKRRG